MTSPGADLVLPETVALGILQYLHAVLKHGQISAFAIQNEDGTLTIMADVGPGKTETVIAPIEGPPGPSGPAQFPLIPQKDIYVDPKDLPTIGTLTNTVADIGKFWVITQYDAHGNVISVGAYIWFGTEYRFLPFGVQGPPGPYGIISPYVRLLPPDQQSQLLVSGDGTTTSPYHADMELSVPHGPFGRCMPLAQFPDVNETGLLMTGDVLMATGETVAHGGKLLPQWQPSSSEDMQLQPYSVPSTNFIPQTEISYPAGAGGTGVLGAGAKGGGKSVPVATICTFTVPPQLWPWKPLVFGQIRMTNWGWWGNVFMGVEVCLGSATGPPIARGFGNTSSGVVSIIPHFSTPDDPHTALNLWNDVGLVPANDHAGLASTLFVNVVNEGNRATYSYTPTDAELLVLACPTRPKPVKVAVTGALSIRSKFSAKNIMRGDL